MAAIHTITLASRKSPLAMQQTETVAAALRRTLGVDTTIIGISTRGDEITDRPLADAGGKALFIKGLQDAISSGAADAAVHSLKDMEAAPTAGFTLAAVGFAADRRDVLISKNGGTLADLAPGAVIGTCSPRRTALLRHYYPALHIRSIRGNLQTRLAKLQAGDYDALLLAAAGLQRLDMQQYISAALPVEQFIPAVGQGLLGIECAADNHALIKQLAAVNDENWYNIARAERSYAAAMDGNCHSALGGYATVRDNQFHLRAFYGGDGSTLYQATAEAATAEAAGKAAAEAICRQRQ